MMWPARRATRRLPRPTAAVALSGGAAANYTLGANTTATTTAKINPKPVTASILTSDKNYDGTNTASITSCTIPGKVGSDDVACTASNATFASANGSGRIERWRSGQLYAGRKHHGDNHRQDQSQAGDGQHRGERQELRWNQHCQHHQLHDSGQSRQR